MLQKTTPPISKDANVVLARILWRTWKEVPGAEVPEDWTSAKPHFMKEARKLAIAMERNGLTITAQDAGAST